MNLLVTPNNDKQGIYESTMKLCKALHEHGATVYMLHSDDEKYKGCCDVSGGNINELTKKCDAVIALGGDGTILRSATIAAVYDKPVLGLNQGRLGFMAGLEISELQLTFGKLKLLLLVSKFGIALIGHFVQSIELFRRNTIDSVTLSSAFFIYVRNGENHLQNEQSSDSASIQLDTSTNSHATVVGLIKLVGLECLVVIKERPIWRIGAFLERIGKTNR